MSAIPRRSLIDSRAGFGATLSTPDAVRAAGFPNRGRLIRGAPRYGVLLCPISRLPSERGGRPSIGRAERVIETAHASEPGRKGDLRQRHRGFVEQAFGGLDPPGHGNFARACTSVAKKKPQEVPRADPELPGKPIDRRPVEKPLLDQAHAARHRGCGTGPCRTSRCRLGTAAKTWAKARPFGSRGGREEHHIFRLGRACWTNRTTIDARGSYPDKE